MVSIESKQPEHFRAKFCFGAQVFDVVGRSGPSAVPKSSFQFDSSVSLPKHQPLHVVRVSGKPFAIVDSHVALLGDCVQSMAANQDFCIVGGKGCGKTVFAQYLADVAGFSGHVYTVHLFKVF